MFCCIHLAISLALDITVGLMTKLQYILLLGQGIFIVWSLLLSAGYFYIYSTMKKVVSRQQCDVNRSMYPKLMFDQNGSGAYSMRLPPASSNPLSRAVNLTLGVAVIGSLMGGVQLYGMIGMHGLLRRDPRDIPDPWYGYQVALRVLEVMICYLLAVVATTPLRQYGAPQVMLLLPIIVVVIYSCLRVWETLVLFLFSLTADSSDLVTPPSNTRSSSLPSFFSSRRSSLMNWNLYFHWACLLLFLLPFVLFFLPPSLTSRLRAP